MTLDDQKHIISLWIQFLDGNENAFSQLYCLFLDDLLTYGRRVGGDNEMVGFFVKFGGNLFFISTVFFFLNPIKSCRYVCFLVTLKTPHH